MTVGVKQSEAWYDSIDPSVNVGGEWKQVNGIYARHAGIWQPGWERITIPPFIFEVKTSSADETFTLPLVSGGTYNFKAYWGDGSNDRITAYDQSEATHTYATPGTHEITLSGIVEGWAFNASSSASKIGDIKQWGGLIISPATGNQFRNCSNLTVSASDVLDVSGVTNMQYMFRSCAQLTGLDASAWDVSNVTRMDGMFDSCSKLVSLNCASWDVSSVTNMFIMFQSCAFFQVLDVDLSAWDVSHVTNMLAMFQNVTISTAHYDALLIAWSQLSLQSGVSFHAGNSKYSAGAAATARSVLINTYNWSITDGGQA